MSFDYLNEAFKKLSLLNEETFDTSLTGLNQLSDFMDKDASDDVVKVIDTEAEFEDEVQDSYIGKVITNCNVCHSHIFENKDEIVIDEDGLVNADKQCPYCGEQAGFTIVGEITPYVKETEETEPEVAIDGTPVDESITAAGVLGTVGLAAAGGVASAAASHLTKKAIDHIEKQNSKKDKKEQIQEDVAGKVVGGLAGTGLGGAVGRAVGTGLGAVGGGLVGAATGNIGQGVEVGGKLGGAVGGAFGGVAGARAGIEAGDKAEDRYRERRKEAEDRYWARHSKDKQEGLIGDTIRGAAKGFLGEEDQDEGLILDTARGAVKGALGISEEQEADEGLILDTVRGGIKGALGIGESTDEGLVGDTIRGAAKGFLGEEDTDEGLIGDTIRGAAKGFLGEEETDEGLILDTVRGGIKGALGIGESTAVLDKPREKDLTQIRGTIADVLINHSAEIDACGANEAAVKACITRILSSDEVKTPEAAQEAIRIINKCKGPKLWSTIGTYMSGLKVASSGKYARRRLDASLEEDVNNVNVETDDSIVNIHAEEGGKVTVSTEPKASEATGEEAIGPLSDETLADIESANGLTTPESDEEVPAEEEAPVEGEEEMDIDEVDETALDELGESYLKEVYENVESFKTSNVSSTDTHLVVEGVIKFKSGATKKTGFIFEAHSVTPDGKVRFTGKNEHFSRGAKSFILTGKIENKKLISESFTYNYRARTADGKSNRIYGTVSKK